MKELLGDELNLVALLQDVCTEEIYFPHEEDALKDLFTLVYDSESWKGWKNNNGKSDPPPDFFSDTHQLLMEVMRVDDNARMNEKKQIYNPRLARDGMILKEINLSIINELHPNTDIAITGVTDLNSDFDHNYQYYYENFRRVLQKHIDKIPNYRCNFPDKKLIFYVFDESTAYICRKSELRSSIHLWFQDQRFIDVVRGTDIDYLIWFTPFKLIRQMADDHPDKSKVDLPQVVVFDVSKLGDLTTETYEQGLVKSVEK